MLVSNKICYLLCPDFKVSKAKCFPHISELASECYLVIYNIIYYSLLWNAPNNSQFLSKQEI